MRDAYSGIRLADRLERQALPVRGPSLADGRRRCLALTPQGATAVEAVLAARQEAIAACLTGLSDRERATLGGLVERVLGTLAIDATTADRICRMCDESACARCPVECATCPATRPQGP